MTQKVPIRPGTELTVEAVEALRFDRGWVDGRARYEWCRFDATVDEKLLLRAEVTWDDNYAELSRAPKAFFNPELLLEVNELKDNCWSRINHCVISLTTQEARSILLLPPSGLLWRFVEKWREMGLHHADTADDPVRV